MADPMPVPVISVIVVNYNGGDFLDHCLRALRDQLFTDFEAIIVDNGSHDGSFERARAKIDDGRFRFLPFGQNLGFAAANNQAAREARGEWLALLNPDAFAEPGWLTALLDATRRLPGVDFFGSTQINARDPGTLDGAGDMYFVAGTPWRGGYGHPISSLPPEREVFSPCAAAALYRASLFRRLEGFDERFFAYCEDVDLAFRARLLGGRCMQVATAVVHHVGGGIAGARSDFARYHGQRNMSWTFVKNMPGPLLWLLLPLHVAALLVLVVRAMVRGDALPTLRALRDAVLGLPAVWKQRRQIQDARTVSTRAIARALTWDVRKYLRRSAD